MRYLRMLSNSVFAGLLASVYLTLLLLHLNPSVPLTTSAVGPLFTVLTVSYGLHIAVVSYALYVIRQIAIVEPSPPGWISLRLLTWSAAVLSGTAAVITWLHASGLQTALDSRALPGILYAATAFALATLVFLVLGVAQIAARRIIARRWRSCSPSRPSRRSPFRCGCERALSRLEPIPPCVPPSIPKACQARGSCCSVSTAHRST
jgi:hypothetical protein